MSKDQLLDYRLIHKLQVKRSKREDFHLNTFTQEQFNFYFIERTSLEPAITFGQFSESSSSLEKAGKMNIS